MADSVIILTLRNLPDGGEKSWTFDPLDMPNYEAIAIERATDLTLNELVHVALPRMSIIGLTALIWVLRLRDEPSLQMADVQFKAKDLKLEYIPSEPEPAAAGPKEDQTDASDDQTPPGGNS